MILFVFEGAEREPRILKTLERLFFGEGERLVCSFGNNIYELYRQLNEFEGDGDIVSILRENKADLPLGVKSSDFSEVYLFFDYDFQNENLELKEMNRRLREMLELFDDETDNGKLYVSYPMVESLCYTKELPDEHFVEYMVSRNDCQTDSFKELARAFSFYGSWDFIELPEAGRHHLRKDEFIKVKENWSILVKQHTSKANYICTGKNCIPEDKKIVSQQRIFAGQEKKYLCEGDAIAILNAFPLFLFEYFRDIK